MTVNIMDARKINDLRIKYPDRIPILLLPSPDSRGPTPTIDRAKFLVPCEYTMNSLMYVVRKRLPQLQPHQAIFLLIQHTVIPATMPMSEVYEQYKSDDGLLRIHYALENTFG